MNIIISAILAFLGLFLRALFALVSFSYNMIMALANLNLFSNVDGGMSAITDRLYVLLGVFMLFRVGFAMLQYIVSPDKMTDKQQGVGSIIKRAIISLAVLVMFQPAMKFAMDLQTIVLEENVLGKVILGVAGDNSNYQKNFGDVLPSTIITSLTSVNADWDKANGGACNNEAFSSVNDIYTYANTEGDLQPQANKCIAQIDGALAEGYSFANLMIPQNFYQWFDQDIIGAASGYLAITPTVFSNNFLLFAILAVAFIFCLLSLALQLGVRVIKLAFLTLIAPIPIIGYIEPKGGKMFTNWAKELGKTYAMLFIRLAALYFAILVIILVSNITAGDLVDYNGNKVVEGSGISQFLVEGQLKIVIFLAAFLFADQVPKMIENIFGLKMEGGMFKNPARQLRESKSLMGTVGRAGTTADALFRANRLLRGKKIENGGLERRNGILGKAANIKGDSKAASIARRMGYRRRSGGQLSTAYQNVANVFSKESRENLKKSLKNTDNIRDKARVLKDAGKEAKDVVVTDASKVGAIISNINKSGRDGAKWMQEHPEESVMENIVDSSVKSKEHLANRLSRTSQDMRSLRMGDDIEIENAKKKLESVKQSQQVIKNNLEEQKRQRTEGAEEDRHLKSTFDAVTSHLEKEEDKKNDLVKDHLSYASSAKTTYETANAELKKLQAQKVALEGTPDMAANSAEIASVSNRIQQLQTELSNANSTVMLSTETPAQFEARVSMRKEQLQEQLNTAVAELERLESQASLSSQNQSKLDDLNIQIAAQERLVSNAKAEEESARNKTAALRDVVLEAAFEVDSKRGFASAADYLNSLSDAEKNEFMNHYIDRMVAEGIPSAVIENFKSRGISSIIGGADMDQFRVNVDALERELDGYLKEDRLPKKLEDLKEKIDSLPLTTPEEIRIHDEMQEDYQRQLDFMNAMIEEKNERGYYDRASLNAFIKSRKRVGDAEVSRIASEFDEELSKLDKVIKELSVQIEEKEEEIKKMKEATKGAGVNEDWRPGEMPSGAPDGPFGPPPGE